ncbi:Signal transduction histidine-protein kinase BarA [Pseudovibrio sp. Ad46]|uniref:hybrid sensor histidine kinase/response regulator n=1 Tax=unclassified Pseudovibrio TaxID=2627060 RepID=UPI0007B18F61|nr:MULTISPECIES: PAS domain-containing hybrid sensor histidine kinase/response regulator [unclassified Pseudovibrio]KZK89214.1 Signal transduction histidine-protein kinase BarA [Pseudovibrio sp. Ad5]KZK95367.1 Signal transduction histidine-protein kinase BarA [Pseudovibrio sp. Ad46]
MLKRRLKTEESTHVVTQARVSLIKQSEITEKSSFVLKSLSIFVGVICLLIALLLTDWQSLQGFYVVLLAFGAGAVLFRRFPASDVIAQSWKTAQIQSEVEQLEDPSELASDTDWQLREADDRHRSILDALGAIVIRCDSNGVVLSVNDAGKRNFPAGFGVEIGGAIHLPYADDFTPDLEEGAAGTTEDVALRTKHGTRWYSLLRLSIRDGSGGAPIIQWILTDVTDRRQAEQKLREDRDHAANASEAKSRFLAMVSHEIRTPLNGVLGMADLLDDTTTTAEQQNYINAIRTSGSTLLMLIDEVLDYSKIEAGKLELETGNVELAPLVERVVELLSPKAHAKGLQIGSFINPAVPDTIQSDPARLQQILYNLVGNAIKFTEEGGVSLVLQVTTDTTGHHLLEFAVQDTGPGMDDVTAARIFREFEQGEYGRDRKFDGAGLGLAISKRLAELMGSSLTVQSQLGCGSTFLLEMPVDEISEDFVKEHNDRIAIITSNQIEADLVYKTLSTSGYNHTKVLAADELEGLSPTIQFDRLLVGEEYVERIRNFYGRQSESAPEIFVLIKPQERARIADIKTGEFSGYLTRPVRRSSLLRVLSPSSLQTDEVDKDIAEEEVASTPQGQSTNLNVLVAEDNPINWTLVQALLDKLGHTSSLAEDGHKAVSLCASGSFDIVLMDLHMPGLDGLEAISKIRGREEKSASKVPIYVVSADVMPDAKEEALNAGADGFLSKPLKKQDLEAVLKRYAKG